MFLLPTFYFWLFCLYNTYKMMDFELNVERWLGDVTLFPNEPSDYSLNFDLLQNEKTNKGAVQADFNDLPWFDEKVDLSILEDPKNVQLLETDLNELLSIIGSSSDNSFLSSEKPNFSYFDNIIDLNSPVTSPVSSADIPFSSEYETLSEGNQSADFPVSPEYETISEAASPVSVISDVTVNSALHRDTPPADLISTDNADKSCQDAVPAVFVTVCNQNVNIDEVTETLSIEEVSNSVKKRKFVSNGKEIRRVQVSLKNTFHPYSKATSKRGNNKAERKKVQNKEAAARYREKKRIVEKELSDEVTGLEEEQKKLRSKHDDLETEIKYLKKLMREVLQKKGVL